MKKAILFGAFPLIALSLAVFGAAPVPVLAQAVACPAGYVCTPVVQTIPSCPAGFVCTPVTTITNGVTVTNVPTVTISTPSETSTQTVAPCYSWSNDLKEGAIGADAVALQTFLMHKGFDIPNISKGLATKGYFGSQTETALKQYQASVEAQVTGIFDATTREKVNSSCGVTSTSPTNPTYPVTSCSVLWWHDSSMLSCSQKQFCGSYMYQGLRTFATQTACQADVTSPGVSSSAITVLSPNGGETWQTGTTQTIKWNDTTPTGYDMRQPTYDIWLIMDQACAPGAACIHGPIAIASSVSGTSYQWAVGVSKQGNGMTGSGRIEICPAGSFVACDSSNSSFTMISDNPQSAITVLSPKGGETWQNGATQTIRWQMNTPYPTNGSSPMMPTYDVWLVSSGGNCNYPYACSNIAIAPQAIAKNVIDESYKWNVGTTMSGNIGTAGGAYKIQVCIAGAFASCGTSSSSFSISSPTVPTTNHSPVINSLTGPTSLTVGQSGTYAASAMDPDGNTINYGFFWGDGTTSSSPNQTSNGSASMSHTFNSPGTFTITVGVSDAQYNVTKQITVTVSANAQATTVYVDKSNRFKFSYPAGVTVADASSGSITRYISINMGLKYNLYFSLQAMADNYSSYTVLSTKNISIAGQQATERVFTSSSGSLVTLQIEVKRYTFTDGSTRSDSFIMNFDTVDAANATASKIESIAQTLEYLSS